MPIVSDEQIEMFGKIANTPDEDRKKTAIQCGLEGCGTRVSYPGPTGRMYKKWAPWCDRKPSLPEPGHLYFYYFGYDANNVVRGALYSEAVGGLSQLDLAVEALIQKARAGDMSGTLPSVEDAGWKHHSFVAVFADFPGWELIDLPGVKPSEQPAGGKKSFSLNFADDTYRTMKRIKNDTFFGSQNREITVRNPVGQDVQLVRYVVCENQHLIPSNGKPRTKPASPGQKKFDDYKFDVAYKIPLAPRSSGQNLIFTIDPGGRNTGP